jgi:hypothetical protein
MNDIRAKCATYKNLTWKILKRSIASLPYTNWAWGVGWIYLNQHKLQQWTVVNMVINIRILYQDSKLNMSAITRLSRIWYTELIIFNYRYSNVGFSWRTYNSSTTDFIQLQRLQWSQIKLSNDYKWFNLKTFWRRTTNCTKYMLTVIRLKPYILGPKLYPRSKILRLVQILQRSRNIQQNQC